MLLEKMGIKIKEYLSNVSLGISHKDTVNKLTGEFFINLYDKDGKIIDQRHFKNIIVNSASILIARLLAGGQTSVDPQGPDHGLWVLAVGTGNSSWDKLNPPDPSVTQKKLESELFRKRFSSVTFVQDQTGLPSDSVTNIIDFQVIFTEAEAVGPIVEFSLFGGGGSIDGDIMLPNMGTMLNYKTFPVISKSNTSTLGIIFRLIT